jgi:hypothetical protein
MNNGKTNSINETNEVKFTKNEEKFLLENEACRIATSHNGIPHIAPVTYKKRSVERRRSTIFKDKTL